MINNSTPTPISLWWLIAESVSWTRPIYIFILFYKMNCVPELFQSMASTFRNRLGWLFLHGNSVKGTGVQPRGQHCSDLTVRGERRQKDQQVSTVQLLPPVRPDNWRGYLMSAAVYCFVSLIFVWTDDHRSWWPQTAVWVSFTMLISDRW